MLYLLTPILRLPYLYLILSICSYNKLLQAYNLLEIPTQILLAVL